MKYFTYTNIGPRDINEDSFFATIKDGTLYTCRQQTDKIGLFRNYDAENIISL